MWQSNGNWHCPNCHWQVIGLPVWRRPDSDSRESEPWLNKISIFSPVKLNWILFSLTARKFDQKLPGKPPLRMKKVWKMVWRHAFLNVHSFYRTSITVQFYMRIVHSSHRTITPSSTTPCLRCLSARLLNLMAEQWQNENQLCIFMSDTLELKPLLCWRRK
jgi:hypothetical protein